MNRNMKDTALIETQEAFYDAYWQDRQKKLNASEVERLAEIMLATAHIKRETGREQFDICDLGCGVGWLSNELVKFGQVTGVDLSPKGIDIARQRWPQVSSFIAHDILGWRPEQKFDLVVSSEVIEHVSDKHAYAETITSVMKPGAYLILTTPNGRCKRAWDRASHGAQPIEEWMTPGELRRLFGQSIAIRSHYTFEFDYLYTGIFRITSAPKLLHLLNTLRLRSLWDGMRRMLDLGLYQILVAQYLGA